MSSMKKLLDMLQKAEERKFAVDQAAAQDIREAEAKVTLASAELRELKREKGQEMMVLKAQYEKRLRDTSYQCRQKVHKANSELSEADAKAERAEKRQRNAEAVARSLTEKLEQLEAHIEWKTQSTGAKLASLEKTMDDRIKRITTQADHRIKGMHTHANQVCTISGTAVAGHASELQDQLSRVHLRSEYRTRFKELCELAKQNLNYDMPAESCRGLQSELVSLWHAQSASVVPRFQAEDPEAAPWTSSRTQCT